MSLRRSFWSLICTALCLNGLVVLGQEPARVTAEPPQDVLFNLKVATDDVEEIEVFAQNPPAGANPAVQRDVLRRVIVNGPGGGLITLHEAQADQPDQGKYWVGLLCNPASDALRTQLDIGSDQGLVVDSVTEGGPAKKAGIQPHDVLIHVTTPKSAQKLTTLVELVNAVQEAQTAPIKVELIRKGKRQTLEVTPEERPKAAAINVTAVPHHHVVWEAARATPDSFGLRWAGPMIVQFTPPQLPDGMTIEFRKAAEGAEKVIVKQGDQTWEADLKALDKLPPKITEHIQRQIAARQGTPARTAWAYAGAGGGAGVAVSQRISVLPDDVKVGISRKGGEPTKISVQKGDVSWEGTEKDLDNCPKELRHIVDTALSGPGGAVRVFSRPVPPPGAGQPVPGFPGNPGPQFPGAPVPQFNPPVMLPMPVARPNDIERQLKDLSEQVERLRQAVEKTQPKQ